MHINTLASKKINNINNKTHSTFWFASFSMSEFSSYTRCVGCGCCCCCSCSCYVFFFRFFVLRFGMAFIFLFVFFISVRECCACVCSYFAAVLALTATARTVPFEKSGETTFEIRKWEGERTTPHTAKHRHQHSRSLKESKESERDNMHKY